MPSAPRGGGISSHPTCYRMALQPAEERRIFGMRSHEAEGCEHPLPLVSPKSMVGAGAAAGATAVRGGAQKEAAQSAHKQPKNQVGPKVVPPIYFGRHKVFRGKRFFPLVRLHQLRVGRGRSTEATKAVPCEQARSILLLLRLIEVRAKRVSRLELHHSSASVQSPQSQLISP